MSQFKVNTERINPEQKQLHAQQTAMNKKLEAKKGLKQDSLLGDIALAALPKLLQLLQPEFTAILTAAKTSPQWQTIHDGLIAVSELKSKKAVVNALLQFLNDSIPS